MFTQLYKSLKYYRYEISEWLEIISYGRYQIYVTVFVGIVAFADIAELTVTAVIIS